MHIIVFLGPYRNLTTLWSAVLGMHPDVLVINHITPELERDVPGIVEAVLSPADFRNALARAVGQEAKTIEDSHAVRDSDADPQLRQAFLRWKPRKHFQVSHVVWKDSGRLTKEFRQRDSLPRFLQCYSDVQFVLPLRNPLDVIVSNVDKGAYLDAYDYSGSSYTDFADWYVDMLQWFMALQLRHPDRFHTLPPNPSTGDLCSLCSWLRLPVHTEWAGDAAASFHVRPTQYDVPPDLRHHLHQKLQQLRLTSDNPLLQSVLASIDIKSNS